MGNLTANAPSGTPPVPSRTFSYDAENRQVQAVINLATTNYTYDVDGRRVTRSTPGVDSQGNPITVVTTFVYDAEGQLAQEYSNGAATDSGTSYLTTDHLGSTRLITDGSAGVKKRFDYLPFGEELLAGTGGRTTAMGYYTALSASLPDLQSTKFTSKERDAETGLDFFGARYMSSAQGRFTSADPLLNSAKPWDPQTWNRYSYALNNPLKYVDPNGLYNLVNSCDADDNKCNKNFNAEAKQLKNSIAALTNAVNGLKAGDEKTRLQASLSALGTENDGNNVNVKFGATTDGSAAQTDPFYNDKTNSIGFNITFDPKRITGGASDWAIDAAHEGTHVADISDPRYSNNATTLSPFSLEYRGYQTSSWAASALGVSSLSYGNGRYQIWNKSWGAVDDKVLTNFITKYEGRTGAAKPSRNHAAQSVGRPEVKGLSHDFTTSF